MNNPAAEFRELFFEKEGFDRMYYRCFIPDKPVGAVCVVHGYTEHSGRYMDFMNFLAGKNFAVIAPDLPGHGRSAKTLGDLKNFRRAVDSVAELIRTVQSTHNVPRFFCIGHSFGGCLTLALAGCHPGLLKGIVAIASMIIIPDYVSPFMRAVSNVLAVVLPKLPVQNINLKEATRNEAVKEIARKDPLYYRGKIRARMGVQMLEGMDVARSVLKNITVPSLIMHGSHDTIMPPRGSEFIFRELTVTDKTHHEYRDWFHELLNEPDKHQVFEYILQWIYERNI